MAEPQQDVPQGADHATMVRIGQAVMLHRGGDREEARNRFAALWTETDMDADLFHRCTIAHYMADTQDDPVDELAWDLRALAAADALEQDGAGRAEHRSAVRARCIPPCTSTWPPITSSWATRRRPGASWSRPGAGWRRSRRTRTGRASWPPSNAWREADRRRRRLTGRVPGRRRRPGHRHGPAAIARLRQRPPRRGAACLLPPGGPPRDRGRPPVRGAACGGRGHLPYWERQMRACALSASQRP